MGRIRIPVPGTIGKSVLIDPAAASKTAALEARVATLERLLSGSSGTAHKNLSGLQVGDDHPQYAQHASVETISGLWNFSTIMTIQGDTLREYIEDRVGALVVDSTSIDFTYSDGAGTLTAATINANPSGLIGMSAVNGTAATPLRSDGRHAIDPAIVPVWTGNHTWNDNIEVRIGTGVDLTIKHDGTDTTLNNVTGEMRLQASGTTSAAIESTGAFDMRHQVQMSNTISPTALAANTDNWNPTDLAKCSAIRASASSAIQLTGIVAQPDGTVMRLLNIGSNNITLVHDATSTAANRFFCPNSANLVIQPNTWVWLTYDGTSSRWRASGLPAGTSSSGGAMVYISDTAVAGAAATNITISSLDLDTDKCYYLQLTIVGAAAGAATLNVFFNGDTTATNYERALIGAIGDNSAFGGLSNGDPGFWSCYIRRCPVTGRVMFIHNGGRINGAAALDYYGVVIWDTSANLTSLTINSSVASQIAIGSSVRLYKITT